MKIGFIGLGRMGSNMVLNLISKKHKVVVYNRSPQPVKQMIKKGATRSYSIEELISKLPKQKIVWIMVLAGKPVDVMISKLVPYLKKGDIIIDGGNSFFKDSIRRYNNLKKKGIHFLDCGTSGGMEGARYGACMMVGGEKRIFKKTEALFRDMSTKNGYSYMGKSGAGHFVKMVHNGIEYGMMGAIAEGVQGINKYKKKFNIELKEVLKVYGHGSIVESRLVSWLDKGYNSLMFKSISGKVPHGETENEMQKLEKLADMPVLHQSRLMRIKTRKKQSFAGKLLAIMRYQFGGHKVNNK
ncbi:decarboxylating 6-phosphogluconate dehydrogenase [Candidatus Woesearchaeota archaeon]|nr:decarboxylating 6-phosphogluconate dehydrogenase [Candidatus Woesearchaeota archaeon]